MAVCIVQTWSFEFGGIKRFGDIYKKIRLWFTDLRGHGSCKAFNLLKKYYNFVTVKQIISTYWIQLKTLFYAFDK